MRIPKLPADGSWSDPAFMDLDPPQRLTLLWFKTNPGHNLCGAFKFSEGTFRLQTGMDPALAAQAFALWPSLLFRSGVWVLCLSWVGEQMGITPSALISPQGRLNNYCTGLIRDLEAIPPDLQTVFLDHHPQLRRFCPLPLGRGKPGPLTPPKGSNGVHDPLQGVALTPSLTPPKGSGELRDPPAEQRTAEQSYAEGGVGGAPDPDPDPTWVDPDYREPVIPTVAEVEHFGRTALEQIPESYSRHYHARRTEKKQWLVKTAYGLDVIDWRAEIVRWWKNDRASWKPDTLAAGPPEKPLTVEELRKKIDKEGTPFNERIALRKQIVALQEKERLAAIIKADVPL